MIEKNRNRNWPLIVSTIPAIVIIIVFIALGYIFPGPDRILSQARGDFDRGNYDLARGQLLKVMETTKIGSAYRNEANLYYALTFVYESRFSEGAKELRQFINDYPNSFWTPQAYYELANCEKNLGNRGQAVVLYQRIITDFPTTTWSQYSKDRLKEIGELKIF
jgi:tetratricopeptide (TPR) repeat protein